MSSSSHELRVKSQEPKRVAVGLSGGVDSSLSAALLVEQGYEVTGVYLECWRGPGCRTDEDRKDALDIALKLGIPFQVLDFKQAYHDKVVDYFYSEYQAGRTPNPDTMCNREIKFGLFYEWAMLQGFDYVATGHYARIMSRDNWITRYSDNQTKNISDPTIQLSDYLLLRGADEKKDQTYFLYQLKPEQLQHILFPIGGMTKLSVRKEATKRDLKTAKKPDSQGICFIGPVNVNAFLKERIQPKDGEVISTDGQVIGAHEGVWFYTIGQRGGWTLDPNYQRHFEGEINPLYVISKNVSKNQITVGSENFLLQTEFEVGQINWLVKPQKQNFTCYLRIRNTGKLVSCQVSLNSNQASVKTEEFLRAVAPGQACVFYSDQSTEAIVLGGGVIAELPRID